MKKGDKVKLKYKPAVTGEITDENAQNVWGAQTNKYKVKYDDKDLIPQEDWHIDSELELIEIELPKGRTGCYNECECGAKHDRHFPDQHSTWCPAYNKPTFI